MIIERTNDMSLVKSILSSDGVWENIGGHLHDKEEFSPDDSWLYVVGIVDGEAVGMVLVHDDDGHDKCHVQIIPKYRKEHSKEFGVLGMAWIWNNTSINRLVASIPAIYPNVIKYAKLQGFEVLRTVDGMYKKDGVTCDLVLMENRRG